MNLSLLTVAFDGIYSELVTASLNKLQINKTHQFFRGHQERGHARHLPLPHHKIFEKKSTLKQKEGNIRDIYTALF
jgi:hypothetical protein